MRTEWSVEDGIWEWVTTANNGEPVADSADDGYNDLDDAIYGFLLSQGNEIDPSQRTEIVNAFRSTLTRTEGGSYTYEHPEHVVSEQTELDLTD